MCEHHFTADLPVAVDLGREAGREEEILSGSFLSVRCPRCATLLKPEFPFRLTDRARQLDIYHLPRIERSRYLAGNTDDVPGDVARVVIGLAELREKLRIADAGLDDRVVEIVKFHLMRRAEQEGARGELEIWFTGRGAGALIFEVHGVRAGEVGRVRVPQENAEAIAADLPRNLKREPYRSFLQGPWVSCFAVTESAVDDGGVP